MALVSTQILTEMSTQDSSSHVAASKSDSRMGLHGLLQG
jgi:hypothetical protein